MSDIFSTARRPARRPLVTDTHGGVLVLGVALGVLISAALAHLVGVGQAVLEVEAAQAAADAAALENAVWHARGMNAIAATNIVMALVAGVLVLWRLLLGATLLASLVAAVAPRIEPGAATELAPVALLARLLEADPKVAARVELMVAALADAQASVAGYTPVIAAREASPQPLDGVAVKPLVFSASAWPASPSAGTEPEPRLASPVSLPVQSDSTSLLCALPPEDWERRAAAALERLSLAAAPALVAEPGRLGRRARRALGLPGQSSPLSLAAQLSGLAEGVAPSVFCPATGDAADALTGAARVLVQAASPASGVESSRSSPLSLSDAQRVSQALERTWQGGAEPATASPARVWAPARNGNVFMRSAALLPAKGDASERAAAESGVGSGVEAPLAHAEMYFDCEGRWERCEPDAAWQPRWTARLRRVHPLGPLLARAAGDARGESLGWLGRALPPLGEQPVGGTRQYSLATRRSERAAGRAGAESLAELLRREAGSERLIH